MRHGWTGLGLGVIVGGLVLGQTWVNAQNQVDRSAQPYSRRPVMLVDQAQRGTTFFQFREQLRQAVKRRDAAYIRTIADPNIQLSFGRGRTLQTEGIGNPQAIFWRRLERAIATGCAPQDGQPNTTQRWACPHVFQSSVGDPFSDVHIIGDGVNVRLEPRTIAPVVGVVSNEVVKIDQYVVGAYSDAQRAAMETFDGWVPVILASGQRGFVSSRFAYKPTGYRAIFQRQGDRWRMVAFLAGD